MSGELTLFISIWPHGNVSVNKDTEEPAENLGITLEADADRFPMLPDPLPDIDLKTYKVLHRTYVNGIFRALIENIISLW